MSDSEIESVLLGQEPLLQLVQSGEIHCFLLSGTSEAGVVELGRQLCLARLGRAPHDHPADLYISPEPMRSDDARGLRSDVATQPLEGDRKAFLLTGADRWPPAIANALLRTLEDPPPGRFFMLVAEDPTKVLPTVASRAVPLRMRALSVDEVEAFLERQGWDKPAARAAAVASDGFPARALKLAGEDIARMLDTLGQHLSLGLSGFPSLSESMAEAPERWLTLMSGVFSRQWRGTGDQRWATACAKVEETKRVLDHYAPVQLAMDVLAFNLMQLGVRLDG